MKPFTCQAACEDKWRRHGPSAREDPLVGCQQLPPGATQPGGRDWTAVAPLPLTADQTRAARQLWRALDTAFIVRLRVRTHPAATSSLTLRACTPSQDADGLAIVLPPGHRGFGAAPDVDFVAAGARMSQEDVARARAQWRTFAAAMPAYPGDDAGVDAMFEGRGVVIIGCVRLPEALMR